MLSQFWHAVLLRQGLRQRQPPLDMLARHGIRRPPDAIDME
jgi:hypothetical protein